MQRGGSAWVEEFCPQSASTHRTDTRARQTLTAGTATFDFAPSYADRIVAAESCGCRRGHRTSLARSPETKMGQESDWVADVKRWCLGRSAGSAAPAAEAVDPDGDVGYEAADPSLQSLQFVEPTSGSPDLG
jgi:hypothetical protein